MSLVLVGFDGSEPSRRALAHAVERARTTGGEVVLLNVLPTAVAKRSLAQMMPAGLELPPPMARSFEDTSLRSMQDAMKEFASSGVRMRAEVREGADPVDAIVGAVRDLKADEVVIGSKSYEAQSVKVGPVAQRLMEKLPHNVTIVR